MNVSIGIDIGGTKTSAGLVATDGAVLRHETRPTPASDGAAAVLRTAADLVTELLCWATGEGLSVQGCGAGVAGTVDPDGVITHSTDSMTGWTGTDVSGGLSTALGLPVRVVNDVHAVALGEHRHGAAVRAANALVIAVGTGIGGALIYRGELVPGQTGTAGAIGHLPVPAAETLRCPCGRTGHLEAYASGPAIVARYLARGGIAGNLEQVAARAANGEDRAEEVIRQAAELLGTALGGLANVLDPEVIVVGGGVASLGAALFGPLDQALRRETLAGPDAVVVRPAALGRLAGVVGAASLVERDGFV